MRGMRAYGYARVKAVKSRLYSRSDLLPLVMSGKRALNTISIDLTRPLFPQLFARLMTFYRSAIDAYRDDREVFLSMLRLHELENVKLMWRAVVRRIPREKWLEFWRDVKDAQAGAPVPPLECTSLHELTEKLKGTPYGDIARRVAGAHGDDLAAAELAFDQWGSSMLLRVARRLPAKERLARQMLESVVASRNAEVSTRARQLYGLSDAALGALIDNVSATPVHLVIDRTFELAPAIDLLLRAEEELRNVNRLAET